MESKYHIETVYTKDIYEEYVRLINSKIRHYNLRIALISVIFALSAVFLLILNSIAFFVGFLFLAVVIPIILVAKMKISINTSWKSNTLIQDAVVVNDFYEDHLEQSNAMGNISLEYSKIIKMLESDRLLVLMFANNQGISVNKSDCTEETLEFIKSRINK